MIESPEEAMRVYLTDHGSPVSLSEEPYFRASVLAEYASNRWTRMAGADSYGLPLRTVNAHTSASIQQTIEMRLPATPELPSLFPPIVPVHDRRNPQGSRRRGHRLRSRDRTDRAADANRRASGW